MGWTRRRHSRNLAGIGAIVLWLGFGGVPQASAVTTNGWPQLLHGPGHTGYNSAETTLTPTSLLTLHQQWTTSVPSTAGQATVVGGNVYVAGTSVSSYTTSGALRWSRALANVGDSNYTSLAVASGSVLVVTQPANPQTGTSTLVSLSASSGRVHWMRPLPGYSQGSPTVSGGLIYTLDNGFGIFHLSAFALSGGVLKWRVVVPSNGDPSWSSATVAGGRVFVNSGGVALTAFDAASGTSLWSTSVGAPGGIVAISDGLTPVASQSTIYATAVGHVVKALSQATGTVIWTSADLGGSPLWLTADSNIGVVVADVSPDSGSSSLAALDMVNGQSRWSGRAPGAFGPAMMANGIIYVGTVGPAIGCYYETSGFEVRSPVQLSTTSNDFPPGPVIADGHLYTVQGPYQPALTVLAP
jgi:outer membrane protein assembly factor BamB